MWKIKRGVFTKLLITQLLSVIECQTWFLLMLSKLSNEELEQVEEGLDRQRNEIDEMQCGFMLGCVTIVNKLLYVSYRRST